jgi:hypothetical protein
MDYLNSRLLLDGFELRRHGPRHPLQRQSNAVTDRIPHTAAKGRHRLCTRPEMAFASGGTIAMRVFPAAVVLLAVAALVGRNTSPPGGSTNRGSAGTHTSSPTTATPADTGDKDATFTIVAPTLATHLAQSETKTVKLSLHRGSRFHEDVTLKLDAPKGLKVDPAETVVKASDKADDIPIRVSADKDAPLGDHTIHVTGTPAKGSPTSVDIKVTVSKP